MKKSMLVFIFILAFASLASASINININVYGNFSSEIDELLGYTWIPDDFNIVKIEFNSSGLINDDYANVIDYDEGYNDTIKIQSYNEQMSLLNEYYFYPYFGLLRSVTQDYVEEEIPNVTEASVFMPYNPSIRYVKFFNTGRELLSLQCDELGNCAEIADCNRDCQNLGFLQGSCNSGAGWFGCGSNTKIDSRDCNSFAGYDACCCEQMPLICAEGQTQECAAENSCSGIQTCSNNAWSNCVTNLQMCSDNICRENCGGSSQECTNGNKQECLAENGCYGTQDCINGQWDARCTSNMQKCSDNVCRLFCNSNPNFLAGKINQAYNFDGFGDYINLGNNPVLQVASGDFSLCAWFKTSGDEEDIISNGVFGDGDYLLMSYQGRLRGHVWYQGNWNVLDSNAIVNDNNWHLGCQVVNANTNILYVDGNLDNSIALVGSKVAGNSNVVIGSRDLNPAGYNFQGLIDDVRVYNRALSSGEVSSLYNLQDINNGLAGYWKLDGDASDSSGNGNNGALITGAVIGGGSLKIVGLIIAGILIVVAVVLMLRKKRKSKKQVPTAS